MTWTSAVACITLPYLLRPNWSLGLAWVFAFDGSVLVLSARDAAGVTLPGRVSMRPSGEPNTCIETYPFIPANSRSVQTQGLTTFARGNQLPQKQKAPPRETFHSSSCSREWGVCAVTTTGIGRFVYQLPPVFQAFSCRYPRRSVQRVGPSLVEPSVKPRCLPLPSVRLHAELVHKQVLGRKGGESLPFDSSKKAVGAVCGRSTRICLWHCGFPIPARRGRLPSLSPDG